MADIWVSMVAIFHFKLWVNLVAKSLVAKCTYQLIGFNKHSVFQKNQGLFLQRRFLMFQTYSKIFFNG